jgi:hypothetical protein
MGIFTPGRRTVSEESEPSTDTSNADDGQSAGDDPRRPARRQVLKGAATLATAVALGGEVSAQDLKNATTPAGDRKVTLTLQQMDISVQPVGKPFDVTLSIRKDSSDNVEIEIPTIERVFSSSKDSPHFARTDFPTLVPEPPAGEKVSSYSYPSFQRIIPWAASSILWTIPYQPRFVLRAAFRSSLWSEANQTPKSDIWVLSTTKVASSFRAWTTTHCMSASL